MILRTLIFLHRWVGVAIGAVFLLWFLSGIGMMYWTFPGVSAGDRLDRAPNLDPSKITLSPAEAAEKAGLDPTYISGIERGLRNPGIKNVAKLAKALSLTTAELCKGVDA